MSNNTNGNTESNIFHLADEIKKEFKIREDGVAVTTIAGTARICDINRSTLGDHFSLSGSESSKLAQSLMQHGFDPVGFCANGIPDTAVELIVEYYAFNANKTTEQALLAYRSFASIGIRAWIYTELGVPITPIKQESVIDAATASQILESIQTLQTIVVSQQREYELIKTEFHNDKKHLRTNYLGIQRIVDAEKYNPSIFIGQYSLLQIMKKYRNMYWQSLYGKKIY